MCKAGVSLPWEESQDYIRSGHRSPDEFEEDSLRTITLIEEEGIKAIIGKPKGKDTTDVQSYLFDKDKWTLEKAKAWFEKHREGLKSVKEHVQAILPFKVLEKIVDKPLRICGVAMTAGMSRNFNIYTPEELQAFTSKLVSAPVYIEHIAVPNAVGKVVKTEWDEDGGNLWYEAEIYDDEVAEKIHKGLIQHVSVGADYETIDILDGQAPHGLHNAELSLVAVPGIPETNIHVLERLAPTGSSGVAQMPLKERGNMKKEIKEQDGEGNNSQNGGQNLTIDDIKQKIADLSVQREDFWNQMYPQPEPEQILSDEERADLQSQIDVIDAEIKALEIALAELIAGQVGETLGEGYTVNLEVKLKEAEWDTEYINDLPDECFAYIEEGGEKDEEGKTKPRSLRHLPFKNAQGNIDHDHLVNALARVKQAKTMPEGGKQAAVKKLCAAVKTWNSEHPDSQITSEVCGVEPSEEEQLKAKVSELLARVETLEKAQKQGNLAESLLKKPKEPVIPVKEAVEILEGLLPSPMVERSTMGMQRECQAIRRAILKLKEMLKSG